MWKPQSLRTALDAFLLSVSLSADQLTLSVDKGQVVATAARSASFEYRYTLVATVRDFPGDPDFLMLALVVWMRQHQPDILLAHAQLKELFAFTLTPVADGLNHIEARLPLTEPVVTELVGNQLSIRPPKPALTERWEFWLKDDKIAEFTDRPAGWPS